METLDDLIQTRGTIKGKLTRFCTYVNKHTIDTINDKIIVELQNRVNNLDRVYAQFDEIQDKIDKAFGDDSEEQLLEREAFENSYYDITAVAQSLIKQHKNRSLATAVEDVDTTVSPIPMLPNVKLPTITLPTFDGSYENWHNFRDIFLTLVHDNMSIDDIQKFYYLRMYLSKQASQVIDSLEVTRDNYTTAWQLLNNRYENKRLTVHNHVNALFTLPALAKESHKSLRELLDKLLKHLRALNNLKEPTNNWDTLIIYLISSKLDSVSKREWETSISNKSDVPKLDEFIKFLTQRCQLLETLNPLQNMQIKPNIVKSKLTTLAISANQNCHLCNKSEHNIYNCETFLKLTAQERIDKIKQLHLCLNCLRKGHSLNQCRSLSLCRHCHRKHNSLLHISYGDKKPITHAASETKQSSKDTPESYVNNHALLQAQPLQILLATACVLINDIYGNQHECRVLLDSGSQANFITKALQTKLLLQPTKINSIITGVNQSCSNISHKTQVNLQSCLNSYNVKLQCLIVNQITEDMPRQSFPIKTWNIPQNIRLADQNFNTEKQIDILLGAEIFWELLCVGQISLGKNQPILQKTRFGWVLSGPIHINHNNMSNPQHCGLVSNLEFELDRFWDIQDSETKTLDKEEQYCEKLFEDTTKRDQTGRFIVKLPLKQNRDKLGNSREIALKRFHSLEKRLFNDHQLKLDYSDFLNEYLALGHMKMIDENIESENNTVKFYLPHHAVVKATSTTTKLRVVFDGSSKSDTGISLNDLQCIGPVIQNDLFNILIRFRKHKYVITADIEKMYRQILVDKDDCSLQRIVWRQHPTDQIQCYELQTVTYGTTSAPYLATRCLYQLSIDNQNTHPTACNSIAKDFYVDDMLTGANTIENLLQLKTDVSNILSSGGFNLRKWLSNINLERVSESIEQDSNVKFDKNLETKMLGVFWNANSDSFTYTIKTNTENKPITKRTILSCVAQIFDPLGLLTPVTIIAKLIIQNLWQYHLSWDESIPIELHTKWLHFANELNVLNNLEIPRYVSLADSLDVQLHGFSDASERAFGACIYIRARDPVDETYQVRLLCAKSRVAPLKQITLPRLELCAAVLLAKLMHKVIGTIDINFSDYYYWTDSQITLCWIKAPCQKWHTFVANRVAKIQRTSDTSKWYHVDSKTNPADLISRGIRSGQIVNPSTIWWYGPDWLAQDQQHWPGSNYEMDLTQHAILEMRNTNLAFVTTKNDLDIFNRYSSLTKLVRTVAWMFRFYRNVQKPRTEQKQPHLSVQELEFALHALIKVAQAQEFAVELKMLRTNSIKYNGNLLALNPFIDKNNIIRVGGRIHLAPLSYAKRHQIILPKNHPLTVLIIKNEHLKNLHCGSQALLSLLREQFWPISGRGLIKRVLRNCTTCFRVNPKAELYKMGNLPTSRLKPAPAFYNCGVDYAGPFLLKDKRTRGNKVIKCYVSLFVCLTTKALHLELVSSLTTEAFLSCLKRFIARRGKPLNIFSDNATNFVGANAAIKLLLTDTGFETKIINDLANQGITWNFIPPRSPHFGGLWEAGVKSVKTHLKRVIGNAALVFEDFYTVLTQIEAMLNSRPLHPLSSDPSDLNPLTPSHFLIGQPLVSIPEKDVSTTSENRLSLYQRLQQLSQHFWARWSKDYINELQMRTKWKQTHMSRLKEGSLVLIREDNMPPLKWKLGRIVKLIPGIDGINRVAEIRTTSGNVKRAVSKVCVLPDANASEQIECMVK